MRRSHLILTAMYTLMVLSTVSGQDLGCMTIGSNNQTAYLGWPILLDLNDVVNYCYAIYEEDSSFIRSTLSYRGSNETLYDTGTFDIYSNYPSLMYQIPNVTDDTPDIVLAVWTVNSSACCTLEKNLKKEILPDLTCQSASGELTNTRSREHTEGDVAIFTCEVLHGSGSPPINISQYTVTWYYQCSTALPEGARITEDGMLTVGRMNHTKHPGLYSCSIVHNGQIRYIVHQRTCIEPNLWSSKVAVKCDKEEYFVDEGSTADVTCNVNIGQGRADSFRYIMIFYPLHANKTQDLSKDNISCPAHLDENWTVAPDKRASCIASAARNASMEDFKCFYHIPTEQEWEDEIDKKVEYLTMSYRLENIQSEDFGYFWAFATITGLSRANSTAIFQISPQPREFNTVLILGCVFGGLAVLVVLLVLGFCLVRSRSAGAKKSEDRRTYVPGKEKTRDEAV